MEADCYLNVPCERFDGEKMQECEPQNGLRQIDGFFEKSLVKMKDLQVSCLMNSPWNQRERSPKGRSNSEEIETGFSPSMHTNRPSTAVREHVKKISEDFTITQTNFENSHKPNPVLICIERPALMSPKIPRSLSSSQSSCSKCESLCKKAPRVVVLPYIAPADASKQTKPSSLLESRAASESPKTQHHLSPTHLPLPNSPLVTRIPSTSSSLHDAPSSTPIPISPKRSKRSSCCLRKYNVCSPNLRPEGRPNKDCCFRTPSAPLRPSLSASSSPRLQQITLEQLKRARQFTERAIKEGRVFSIYGYFPAIRFALKTRGWVEKVLHRAPYINPHPANCVCFQAHCTAGTVIPLSGNGSVASGTTSGGPARISNGSSNDQLGLKATGQTRRSFNFIEHNKKLCKTSRSKLTNDSNIEECDSEDVTQECSENLSKDEVVTDVNIVDQMTNTSSESCDRGNSASSNDFEGPSLEDAEGPSLEDAEGPSLEDAEGPSLEDAEGPSLEDAEGPSLEDAETDECDGIVDGNENVEHCQLKYSFNPSVLCPEEIRSGLQNCIKESNECIYQYTVPVYERPNMRKKAEDVVQGEDSKGEEAVSDHHCGDVSNENMEPQQTEEDSEEEAEGDQQKSDDSKRLMFDPLNPYPEFEFDINEVDTSLVGRLLKNVEPNLIWTWTKDSVSYKHLTKDQIVNRFPNTPFTTKHGLCSSMQQLHWFSETASADSFVPRGYCIGQAEERSAFVQDYRITACLALLVWVTETHAQGGNKALADPMGEVSLRRVRQAVEQVERFVESCSHEHLDSPAPAPLPACDWEGVLSAHHRAVHNKKRVKATTAQAKLLVSACAQALARVEQHWPQLAMDGVRNVWIVKPGAQSRGRGIQLMDSLQDILALVQSPFIYETKYVVQKYMERPFLVYNTKFDIRQWFLVTDWNPLTVWMYRSSYVRFCSQQYDLSRSDEAVHLSNNAIQCKYTNGARSPLLPQENMWDSNTFAAFLDEEGWRGAWEDTVYPGMRAALVAAMLAAQVEMDAFKHGFELFGADFMLSEDLRPWLIEINSSPCMAATSSVTRRLCSQCLQDIIKVVVDHRRCRDADTGDFVLIHRDSQRVQPPPPYLGVNLQIVGKQIPRQSPSSDKSRRASKPSKPVDLAVKPLRLISFGVDNT